MRVLIVHNRYQQAGGEDMVVALEAQMLRAAGHDVTLAEVNNDGISGLAAKARTLLRTPYDSKRRGWMAEAVKAANAEVVHIHNFFPRLTPAVHDGAAATGAAVVQTLHNYRLICAGAMLMRDGHVCEDCLTGNRLSGVVHRCYRGSVAGSLAVTVMQNRARREGIWEHSVDRFIALTDFARGKFSEGGLPAERIAVKANAIPWTEADTGTARNGALFVGRLSPEKGGRTLLDAWRQLGEVPLTVIGDGPERAALEATAPRHVRFLGRQSPAEVRQAMLAAAMLIVPSVWYEGFPMTIVEAYAAGLPVVASRIGSLAEVVVDGLTGRCFAPGDAGQLAQMVRELNAVPESLRAMGAAARAAYEAQYSPGPNMARLEAIYDEALAAARRRRGA